MQEIFNLEEMDKKVVWNKQLSILGKIGREDGDTPIDTEALKETICAFNVNGIDTLASNAGHVLEERGAGDLCYPWVLISSKKNQKQKEYEGERDDQKRDLIMKVQSLLDEFYKDRKPEVGIALKINNDDEDQFILSSVDERFVQRQQDGQLTESEKKDLIMKLSDRQQELYEFGHFLKSKFFDGRKAT